MASQAIHPDEATVLLLVLPHQLFRDHPGLAFKPDRVLLWEHPLFFGDQRYPAKFHQQKLWLHRATMKRFAKGLSDDGYSVFYADYNPGDTLGSILKDELENAGGEIAVVDPTDFVAEKRLRQQCEHLGLKLRLLPNPSFLNQREQNETYRAGKKRWAMADFYKWQRTRLGILLDEVGGPVGGRWSFDDENRKKVPKRLLNEIPPNWIVPHDAFELDAREYVEERFADHPGELSQLVYPTSHENAETWLKHFLEHRFERFGDYEDAIVEGESWLWHSVLTPMLNIGLLTPERIVRQTLDYADQHSIPLNSVEGFIRQIIGWREFMRATYEDIGVRMRTGNHWKHEHAMPDCFYDATTGIDPVDDTIRRLLETGYSHHIERLMVLGGFMFLCEIKPDAIYKWFMEMYVDSYDWVMVPNVYAMSQNADGGLITTKPYFSGSSYVRKMSHYAKGPWCDAWDGLYWRWIWNHRKELGKNPRWAMMCRMAEKMDAVKREQHLATANQFLTELHPS